MTDKPEFDPTRTLRMAQAKTVLGHFLPSGTTVSIVDEPAAPGEVDRLVGRRLWLSGMAIYADEARPTPVETPEQEKARLAADALSEGSAGSDAEFTPPADLVRWQADDAETGKKKGGRVTNTDLLVIAGREGALVETDDNKDELIRKIVEHRAAAASNLTSEVQNPPPPAVGEAQSEGGEESDESDADEADATE